MTTTAVRTKPPDCEGNSSSRINSTTHTSSRFTSTASSWLTMELVDGGTASAVAENEDRLAALAQIADALDYTHRCGIVHCDVKPSNILVSQDFSRAVLIDFGVAHAVAETVWHRPTHLEASLPYTAPELLRGRPPSARTDAVRTGLHGGRTATRCTAILGRNADGTDGRPSQPARAELLAQERLGATELSTRFWAGRWRRSRTADMTRARSSSRSSTRALG